MTDEQRTYITLKYGSMHNAFEELISLGTARTDVDGVWLTLVSEELFPNLKLKHI